MLENVLVDAQVRVGVEVVVLNLHGRHRRLPGRAEGPTKIKTFWFFFCKICKFLAGSFSAVSKRNFARKYAFDSIFQDLQDVHMFAPLQTQHFSKTSYLGRNR